MIGNLAEYIIYVICSVLLLRHVMVLMIRMRMMRISFVILFNSGKRKPSFKMVSNLVINLLHSINYKMEVTIFQSSFPFYYCHHNNHFSSYSDIICILSCMFPIPTHPNSSWRCKNNCLSFIIYFAGSLFQHVSTAGRDAENNAENQGKLTTMWNMA